MTSGPVQCLLQPTWFFGTLLYGCGPNYLVGLVGLPIIGCISIKRYACGQNTSTYLKIMKFLSISLIPVVGCMVGIYCAKYL